MSPLETQALVVFGYGWITALATGLGAVPFAFVRAVSGRAIAIANAIAAGLMLGASFGLVIEGSREGAVETVVGANAGVLLILLTQRWLAHRDVSLGALTGGDARQALLMIIVMTVHSFSEGVAVGCSFAGSQGLAIAITGAIAVHNIPEGLAISAVLRPRGTSLLQCAAWSVASSIPQPLMAVPAFLLVESIRPALPYGIGFAAGAMIFMVLVELLPEAYEESPRATIGLVTSISLVVMILFQRTL